MSTGTVKWFNENKGEGVIKDQDGREFYVHYSHIAEKGFRTLEEGEKVRIKIAKVQGQWRILKVIKK